MTATTPKRLTEEEVWRKYVRSAGAWTERDIHQHGWNGAIANSPLPECVAALAGFVSVIDSGALVMREGLTLGMQSSVKTIVLQAHDALAAARAALSTEAQP